MLTLGCAIETSEVDDADMQADEKDWFEYLQGKYQFPQGFDFRMNPDQALRLAARDEAETIVFMADLNDPIYEETLRDLAQVFDQNKKRFSVKSVKNRAPDVLRQLIERTGGTFFHDPDRKLLGKRSDYGVPQIFRGRSGSTRLDRGVPED